MLIAFAVIYCFYYTLCCFVALHYSTKRTSGRVLVVFLFESVYELTDVTSNVNGWLPVQDGGTWRSDTDCYITSSIYKYTAPYRFCVVEVCLKFP